MKIIQEGKYKSILNGKPVVFKEISAEEFNNFATTHPLANFNQTIEMAKFQQFQGRPVYYVALTEQNGSIICATFLVEYHLKFGMKSFRSLGGWLADYRDENLVSIFSEKMKLFVKAHGGIEFSMSPNISDVERDINGNAVKEISPSVCKILLNAGFKKCGKEKGYENNELPKWQFVLPIKGKSYKDLLHEMSQKTRNQINAAHKKGIIVRDLHNDEFDLFEDIIYKTSNRQGFSYSRQVGFFKNQFDIMHQIMKAKIAEMHVPIYLQHLDSLKKSLDEEKQENLVILKDQPNRIKLKKRIKAIDDELELVEKGMQDANILKEKYGDVIAMSVSMFFMSEREIVYGYSGTYPQFLKFNPSVAIQADIIKYVSEHNYKRYNFYGISGYFNKGEEGFGVYNFKRGFGGYVVELVGNFKLITSPVKYNFYHLLKKMIGR